MSGLRASRGTLSPGRQVSGNGAGALPGLWDEAWSDGAGRERSLCLVP